MATHELSKLLRAWHDSRHVDPDDFARVVLSGTERLANLLGGDAADRSGLLTSRAQTFVDDSIAVLKAALKLNPDESTVLYWFNNERLPMLSQSTPVEAVASGHVDAVLIYVASLDAGWSG